MSDEQPALWEIPAPGRRPAGPLRRLLTARITRAEADGNDIPADLALVTLSLADRIDIANGGGDRRGFVMLCAEYRAARDQLLGGIEGVANDGFDAAFQAFVAGEQGK